MLDLQIYHDNLIKSTSLRHIRFLYERINWDHRMIGIKGPRGSGKTTLMLQRIALEIGKKAAEALYITLEHPYFYNHSLFDVAQNFYQNGGKYLFIDEVHKYPRWARELKVIYDGFPELHTVFSASSALDIYQGEADLSRRVITYNLPGLSFREYLNFQKQEKYSEITIQDLLLRHREVAGEISEKHLILPLFRSYLRSGYLPIFLETKEHEYFIRLHRIINAVIETDLAYTEGYTPATASRVKKLLGVIAESVPFKPNITALAGKLEVSRDIIYNFLHQLQNAQLVNFLRQEGKGVSTLQKPEKLFLENTNLAYALRNQPETGSLRETFLLNQLRNAELEVKAPPRGDFVVAMDPKLTIEVGGRNKEAEQVKDVENAVLALDEILVGYQTKIPLWLFGFLY
jgi:predicted AAA+ superfamily ATPase